MAGHADLAPCFEAALQRLVFPAPSRDRFGVDMPTELSPPFDERRAHDEATEGVSQRLARRVIREAVRGHPVQIRTCYEALGAPLSNTDPTAPCPLTSTRARAA